MKTEYLVGETIEIRGHDRVPDGDYVVMGVGNDVAGNDPAKYKKIYQCKEATTHRTFSIHESDLENYEIQVSKPAIVIPSPEPEEPIHEEKPKEE